VGGLPVPAGVLIAGQVILTVMMVAGAILLVVGVNALVDARLFVAKAAAANGTVVEVAETVQRVQKRSPGADWYDEDVTVFHPVVQFVTAREQPVRFQASEGSSDPFAYGVGDSIRILYDPANPQDARLDTWASRWGDSITLGVVGLGLVFLGGLGLWLFRSPGRAARRAARQNQDANGGAGPAPTP
jgi:Protein of unknown function (DUF3592)